MKILLRYNKNDCNCNNCNPTKASMPFHYEMDNVDYSDNIIESQMIEQLYEDPETIYIRVDEKKNKKKKSDRCIKIAKRKYHKWPSAYASGAVVKCRQGKIWKGIKESKDNAVDFEIIEIDEDAVEKILEKYKPVKQSSLKDWFDQNQGKGWIDCKTGEPCGRKKAGRGAERAYPACRPTKVHCNKTGTDSKEGPKNVSWKPKKKKPKKDSKS